jgi:hypothetical protein
MDDRGRTVEYDPRRLKGVAVYREDERNFSVGDRIQFRAPYPEKRITTNEIAYVERIDGDRMTVRMDDEKQKQITLDLSTYKHVDYGYAVTSQGSQGLGAHRAIINANAYEGAKLLNERMGYVADSRAERDATIYTNSIEGLPYAIARTSDKETALDAKLTTDQRRGLIEQQRATEIEQRQVREIERDRGYDRGGFSRVVLNHCERFYRTPIKRFLNLGFIWPSGRPFGLNPAQENATSNLKKAADRR